MDSKNGNITGIVLAGGKSSRMGTDKSLMLFMGKPLIQHAIDIIAPLCGQVVISSNKDIYDFTGCKVWPDETPLQAPVVGIYSCLMKSDTELNLVISCDMPFVSTSLFEFLLSMHSGFDMVIPRHDTQYMEPLCGVYRKSLIPTLKENIGSGNLSLQQLPGKSRSLIVDINSSNSFYKAGMFLNINTLQDYNQISNL